MHGSETPSSGIAVEVHQSVDVSLGGFHVRRSAGQVRLSGWVWRAHGGVLQEPGRIVAHFLDDKGHETAGSCVLCLVSDLPRGRITYPTCRGIGMVRRARLTVAVDDRDAQIFRITIAVDPASS